jgi:hypothetical protein
MSSPEEVTKECVYTIVYVERERFLQLAVNHKNGREGS